RARPALGMILDVDNYLRESPDDATPRARITERFVSLLRYVGRRSFDRVVIISHSQGSVVSADLLRLLTHGVTPDTSLVSPERFRLVTMGCPLRQLYGANFPYLYAWVTASDKPPAREGDQQANEQEPV